MDDSDKPWVCAAGRTAFHGGRWPEGHPCELPTEHHHIIISAGNRIELCDTHFAEVNAAGYVTDPYVGPEGAHILAAQERAEIMADNPHELVINACYTPAQAGPTDDPFARIDKCADCSQPIWVSSITERRIAKEAPGHPVLCLCHGCARKRFVASDDELVWMLAPQQEWMRSFLQDRPKRTGFGRERI